jgi:hypothetical protein
MLSYHCFYIFPYHGNLCIPEGRALHPPLLGGARVDLHQKDVTNEREVGVSLAPQLPNQLLSLGLQRIRMSLISKG